MNRRDWTCLGLALIAGGFAATVDMHATDVQATVLTLLVLGVLLGFAQPRRWWLWGIAEGGTIPLAYVVAPSLGITPRAWPEPSTFAALLAVLPAFVATALGAALASGAPEGRP